MLTRHLQGRDRLAEPASWCVGPVSAPAVASERLPSGSATVRQYEGMEPPVGTTARWVEARLRAAGCVFAEDEARLLISAATTPADLTSMVERRAAGEPIEHVIGWAEFCGMRIVVDPGVFVPRRRTEFLVAHAIAVTRPRAVVLDMCCGSGAIGAAIAATIGAIDLHAVDMDPRAVACARRNVATAAGEVSQGDLYDAVPASLRGRVDVLVANAPYVPTDDIALMPAEARVYEPRVALDGGPDGLDVQRRVIDGAPSWLAPRGCLLIETSARQAHQTEEAFVSSGLSARVATSDALGATVVIGTRPSDAPEIVRE